MFRSLTGLPEIFDDELILDVSGIGYQVFCSQKIIKNITPNNKIKLYIETIVREDQISLYGFTTLTDLKWFRLMITVKGVGPKVALNILSHVEFDSFAKDVMLGNKTNLSKINGIGPRTAERIIVELKDKIADIESVAFDIEVVNPVKNDAVSALISLGFARHDASKVVANLIKANDNIETKELIRMSLKELSK